MHSWKNALVYYELCFTEFPVSSLNFTWFPSNCVCQPTRNNLNSSSTYFLPCHIVPTGLFFGSSLHSGPRQDRRPRPGEASVQCLLPITVWSHPSCSFLRPCNRVLLICLTSHIILACQLLVPHWLANFWHSPSLLNNSCESLNSTFCLLIRDTAYISQIASILDLNKTQNSPIQKLRRGLRFFWGHFYNRRRYCDANYKVYGDINVFLFCYMKLFSSKGDIETSVPSSFDLDSNTAVFTPF